MGVYEIFWCLVSDLPLQHLPERVRALVGTELTAHVTNSAPDLDRTRRGRVNVAVWTGVVSYLDVS